MRTSLEKEQIELRGSLTELHPEVEAGKKVDIIKLAEEAKALSEAEKREDTDADH